MQDLPAKSNVSDNGLEHTLRVEHILPSGKLSSLYVWSVSDGEVKLYYHDTWSQAYKTFLA